MQSEGAQPRARKLGRSLLLGLILALAALALLGFGGVQRLDNLFFDTMVRVHERPANDEILIVAIDEKSLRALGRWPWSRRVHARLLDRLTAVGAGAVGIDILFSEPDRADPEGDAMLATAIAQNGRVVLVVGPEGADGDNGRGSLISEVLPLPDLAVSAAMLAHIDFEMDPDGICRRVFLRAGLGNPHWPAMGLALLQITHPELSLPGTTATTVTASAGAGWMRDQPVLISYAGPPGHIKRVSYIDVLEGRVPAEQLRNRIVMIGATAVGLGDTLSTPLSIGHTLMPGIEVNANLVATLLDQRLLQDADSTWRPIANLLAILFLLLWLLLLPGRLAPAGLLLSVTGTLAASVTLLALQRVWFPPAISLLLQTTLYILWSWLDLDQLSRLSLRLTQQMHTQARRDRVTGLPNRPQLLERLEEILAGKPGSPAEFALLILTVGRHRSVIELAGMRGTDALHRQIAKRLERALPGEQRLYRLDRGEFAALIDQESALPHVETIAARVVQSLLRPFQLGDDQFTVHPNIGAARFPQDGAEARQLIDRAYTAMHRARENRSRNFFFYSRKITADIQKQSRINQDLRRANWQEELSCVYQPQVEVATGRLVGVETLVRWHNPQLGSISPADFIPVAEREGLIIAIGRWILDQACNQGQQWRETRGWNLRIAVNVSAIQLESPGLLDTVRTVLAASGLPATSLELELTETALLADLKSTRATLSALKGLDVELAIDDFGTGYSSLTYVKNFPVDRIKIDQSFITDVHQSNESAAITRSIVSMTHGLDLQVIAEGVERQEHLDFLRELGCEEAQGYLIGRPMTPEQLANAIESGQLQLA